MEIIMNLLLMLGGCSVHVWHEADEHRSGAKCRIRHTQSFKRSIKTES